MIYKAKDTDLESAQNLLANRNIITKNYSIDVIINVCCDIPFR